MNSLDDELSELYDADVPRVDLVGKAANGVPRFLIAKQEQGTASLLDAAFVRDLIAKSEPATTEETVTMSGSPAAIAALIHGAPVRKTADDPGLGPEATVEPQAETPHIRAADGSIEKATDAMAMDDIDGMDPTVVLAESDMDAPGDDGDPGSPAWEAIDAATARKWTSILARARTALGVMADREALEAATGDADDMDNAMDLDDASCAIDYAISVLAPFAVDEQAEADCGTDMEMLGKALAGFDAAPLELIEALAPVRKAGRTLSSANEAAIRGAVDQLQTILASLPKAPDVPEAAVQKETEPMSDTVEDALTDRVPLGTPKDPASAETPAAVPGPGAVAKAGKPTQVAIYTADGTLVGTVDPAEITMLAPAQAPAAAPEAPAGEADVAEPGALPDAPPADMTPAPPATVGTPADATATDDDPNVAKAAEDSTTETVLKSIAESLLKAAMDDYSAKQDAAATAARAEQAEIVKSLEERNQALEDRLEKVENAPAVMAIASNGAIPPPHLLRGQDRGAPADMSRAQLLKSRLAASDDAVEKKQIADEMQAMAIDRFSAMQRR